MPPMNQPGSSPRAREQPRAHRARRRLAVRAGDDERPASLEEVLAQRAGHRRARQPEPLGGLRLRVVAADRVAHDDEVGPASRCAAS